MQHKLTSRVRAFLRDVDSGAGRPFVVGVSGGPDSLVLLHVLRRLVPDERLVVVHVNHGLRLEADDEAQALGRLAAKWGLEYRLQSVDVAALAVARGWSVEEAGREARYEALASIAREIGAAAVLVGHNADDQTETLLIHLLRGSGLQGLRGMAPIGVVPGAGEIPLWRPLLTTSRAEIEAYCAGHDLAPFDDESNQDTSYERNRVRHEILPRLTSFSPQFARRLHQLAKVVRAEDELAEGLLDEVWPELLQELGPHWLVLHRERFVAQPLALQRRIVRRAYETLYGTTNDLSFRAVENALVIPANPQAGAKASLPGGVYLIADAQTLIMTRLPDDLASDQPQLAGATRMVLRVPGRLPLANGWILAAEWQEMTLQEVRANRDPWHAYLQLDADAQLLVRGREEGERMQPLGLDGRSATLQDIFVNRKVPGRLRDQWPLVSTGKHVVWVVGHVIDHRARVTAVRAPVVALHCRRVDTLVSLKVNSGG